VKLTVEKRKELESRGGDIRRKALQEDRKLTEPEASELRGIEIELDKDEFERKFGLVAQVEHQRGEGRSPESPDEGRRMFLAGVEQRSDRREPRSGEEVRIFKPAERLAEIPYNGPGIGAMVRGLVTGKWRGAEELRAMVEGTPSAGGYLVPTPLSLQVIDLMRARAQVINAGAVTVPMTSATLKMARLASDLTAGWQAGENAPVTFSDNTFEQVLFTAWTLASASKLSLQLVEDANNIDAIVSDSISKSLALELDRASLYGTGAANFMPLGIKLQPQVTLTPVNAAPTNWSPLSTATSRLMGFNFQAPFGAIYSSRTAGELDNLKDTLGQPMRQPDLVSALGKYVSNQIPNNLSGGSPVTSTTSDIFVGKWENCMIGMRTELVMEVSREAADASGSAFSQLQLWIRAYLRADVQLAHGQAFNVLTGVA
jgi:HK97 family phage major capsid protein